jgi:tetratricopeptide (TPR) repeat protein
MNNQKVKNILILLAVLVLAAVFYFTRDKVSPVEKIVNQEELVDKQPENKDVLVVPPKVNEVSVSENNQKFNAAMNNANNAFMKADYNLAINYYNEAITYKKYEGAYIGLYNTYLAQKNWSKALSAINNAINANPLLGDPWKWKILVMDEGIKSSFTDLKKVYEEGYPKVKTSEKVNLVTYFASLSAKKGEKAYAITLWQKAIELNPDTKDLYQKEIDSLNK